MTILGNMVSILNNTNFYKISDKSFIFAELSCYSLILEYIVDNLYSSLNNIFFSSFDSFGEYMYDHLFQIGNPIISASERSNIYSSRLSISDKSYTKDEILSSIKSGGIEVELIEDIPNNHIQINIIKNLGIYSDQLHIERFIKNFLPSYSTNSFKHI
ncbi:MAG: hypothetical protein KFW09_01885 [Oscillospiraceae bacterium]|nr:hypothetical protein [Oscillospiraceae bacterium]